MHLRRIWIILFTAMLAFAVGGIALASGAAATSNSHGVATVQHPAKVVQHDKVTIQLKINGKVVNVDQSNARRTEAHTDYQMYGNDCNNSPCGEHIWITGNPNNQSVRARVECLNDTYVYGGWHTSVGEESSTSECNDGAEDGEMQYTMQPLTDFCYIRPADWGRASCS